MSIFDHQAHVRETHKRKLDWMRRQAFHRRTGQAPPIQWADPPVLLTEREARRGLRVRAALAMRELCKR